MFFRYEPQSVAAAGAYFYRVVAKILSRDFEVRRRPEKRVCAECDLQLYCHEQGNITVHA